MRLVPALLVLAATATAQSSGRRTYINPIDIEYKYNWEQLNQGISYRSGAAPGVVTHRGVFSLSPPAAGGSGRPRAWVRGGFGGPSRWPFDDVVAPAVASFGDTLLLMQSAT